MSPRVFVSYSHDSDVHKARVDDFIARLRGDDVVVVYDEDVAKVGGPDEGWPDWCRQQIVECDYILACCTAGYRQRFSGGPRMETGRGVAWEARHIRNYLYNNPNANRKIRPLILNETDRSHIPEDLQSYHVFLATRSQSYAELLGWLKVTANRAVSPPPAAIDWPTSADDFQRRLADRSREFDRFKSMLSGHSSQRALLVQGPSNSGKTVLINECVAYASHVGMQYSHIDFKGGRPLEDVVGYLALDLKEAMLPKTCAPEGSTQAYAVIDDLQELRKPLFLAFDTFQEAPQAGQSWIEMLLARIDRCPALIIAVAGQSIPEHSGRIWAPLAYTAALPPILSVDDWIDFVRRNDGLIGVKREHVEALTLAMDGNPGQVSAMIYAVAQKLAPT